jgi:hypothetical protein
MKTVVAFVLLMIFNMVVNAQQNLTADTLFAKGYFAAAKEAYSHQINNGIEIQHSLKQSGYIALLSNKFKEAEHFFKKTLEQNSTDTVAKKILAECYYRQDRFKEAADLLIQVGNNARASLLNYFENKIPYKVASKKNVTPLKFINTDPLPVVKVTIKGKEYNFILDTGGPEIIIDDELAKELSLKIFGSNEGEFAAGKKKMYQYGFLESLEVGKFTISNLPVNILSTKKFAAAAGGLPVSGIIGTVFLYHFFSTIDYKNGELLLHQKDEVNRKKINTQKSASFPFWMAGDHYMVGWGNVNDTDSCLFFIDTGLAGIGFTGPASTIDAANVKFIGNSMEGEGGGGTVKVIPFIANTIAFGTLKGTNIIGVSGAFPASLEYGFKFRIGGLISHSFFRGNRLTFDFENMIVRVN